MKMQSLEKNLAEASTEEELKNFFAKFFHIKLSTKNFIDLYTPEILFEFKLDAPLKNLPVRAKTVAQTLYYIRRLKFGADSRVPSKNICVVTKNLAVFYSTAHFENFYNDKKIYDWDLAASSPCKKLVAALAEDELLKTCHVYDFAAPEDENNFIALINRNLSAQFSLFDDKKEITEQNFYQIFKLWEKIFGADVVNGHKPSEYFLLDAEDGKTEILRHGILFRMSGGERLEKPLNLDEYKHFWSVYEKISSPRNVIAIRQKMDRMTENTLRRFTGEFFTPLDFAQKAIDYLARTVGENWFKSGKFRLWDMAAGTGNLEFNLPVDALPYCYISTLLKDDADYCAKIFPTASVFQYDYLNDDVNFLVNGAELEKLGVVRKMPKKLVDDLKNPELRWIIFINPPYATASNFERSKNRRDKDGVSMTKIRELMTEENLGAVSRELFAQFIYRISREFANRQAWLGIFSTLKYINSNNDQKFRDKVFRYSFERGFVFSSKNFHGCKGQFPVGFLIWNLGKNFPIEEQKISLDVLNPDVDKIATKTFHPARNENFLSRWVKRPKNTKIFPPMSSGLNFAFNKKISCDRIPDGFLASLMCWNDFLHQTYTAILSGPYGTAGGMSITAENFERYMVIHAVHLIPKATWLNDRDQFMQPTQKLSAEFVADAVVWSLFAPSNQTVSLRGVEYGGEIYRMKNNFFPFLLEQVRSWRCTSPEIRLQLARAAEDRFAAQWLQKHRAELSAEASGVLSEGRALYKKFFAELERLDVARLKITDWDAGWYQVRMALGASVDLSALSGKLLPQIYTLGFLRDEVRYFD